MLQQQQQQVLKGPVLITCFDVELACSTVGCLLQHFPQTQLRLLVRPKDDLEHLRKLPVRRYLFSRDQSEAFQGVDSVFLIPPPTHKRLKIAVEVISAAKQAGVRFILSLAHLAGEKYPKTALAKVNRDIEEELKTSEIPHCILNTEIPMDLFLADSLNVKRNSSFYYPLDPDCRLNPICHSDLGEICAKILMTSHEQEGARYTLTGPEPISMTDVAEVYSQIMGRCIKFMQSTQRNAVLSFIGRGYSEWFAYGMVQLMLDMSTNEFNFTSPDAAQLLGREPLTFAKFIELHKDLYLNGDD